MLIGHKSHLANENDLWFDPDELHKDVLADDADDPWIGNAKIRHNLVSTCTHVSSGIKDVL